jgi:putative transcriptional regulator
VRNDLAERRAQLRWSQATVAERLGVSRQTVISIERGRFDPSLPLAFRISAVFGARIDEIFVPEDEPATTEQPG